MKYFFLIFIKLGLDSIDTNFNEEEVTKNLYAGWLYFLLYFGLGELFPLYVMIIFQSRYFFFLFITIT